MSQPISLPSRQRFRQKMESIEKADEILDALNQFLERFTLIGANFSSTSWETVYELNFSDIDTVMVTYSILAKEGMSYRAGFKRTAVFYKDPLVQIVKLEQTDFTAASASEFGARMITDGNVVKLQVKGRSNNLTQWKGSIEIEKMGV